MRNALSLLLVCLWHVCPAQPVRYDIVISEIMANPGAAPALPSVKYIELFNRSATTVNLKGWSISDTATTAIIQEAFELLPGHFVIVSSTASSIQLQLFEPVIGVRFFPTLRVNGDELVLRSPDGKVIHAVAYNRSWYANEVKSVGGWSLEMVDTNNPCAGSNNWTASNDPSGGTPGRINSVAGSHPDRAPPQLKQVVAGDRNIILYFDESLDSVSAANIRNYSVEGLTLQSAQAIAPFFKSVIIHTAPSVPNRPYTIKVAQVKDCVGNVILPVSVKFGQPVSPAAGDIIFNEILFNPRENGTDYIELYNASGNIINLKDLYITNQTSGGNTGTLRQVTTTDRLLFPEEYVLLTDDTAAVLQQYNTSNPEAFLEMSALPSMPNTAGHILLFNRLGEIIEELQYEEKWHFPLVTNAKGVALERVYPNNPTQEKTNWHSAAASVGYGTPGYKNSQFSTPASAPDEITILPQIFSPDNDGFDDFLTIGYRFPEPGNTCNITIFDAHGRQIRKLVNNALCGRDGNFRWDGLDENNQSLRIGIYVIYVEIFHRDGKTKQYKKAVTLARRL